MSIVDEYKTLFSPEDVLIKDDRGATLSVTSNWSGPGFSSSATHYSLNSRDECIYLGIRDPNSEAGCSDVDSCLGITVAGAEELAQKLLDIAGYIKSRAVKNGE